MSFWDSQGTVEPLVVLDSGPKLWKRSTLRGCVQLHVVYFALVIVPVMPPYSLWNLRNCTSELKICESLVMFKSLIRFHCFSMMHLHNTLIFLLRPGCSQVLLFCINYGCCYLNLDRTIKFEYKRNAKMMCAVTIQMKPLIHRLRFYRKKFIIFCEFVSLASIRSGAMSQEFCSVRSILCWSHYFLYLYRHKLIL